MTSSNRFKQFVIVGAVALGAAVGSYGIASAASGSGSSSGSNAAPAATATPVAATPQQPWGHQRSDETVLTGDTASKVTAAAKAKLPGATIVRVETDADGNSTYEAHVVQSDGTPATVYVDSSFDVVSVETR